MDVACYLPEEIGARAKAADLPFSRLLRDAVTDELERREAMKQTLNEPTVYEVTVEDDDNRTYVGRITGALIASDHRDEVTVYLTTDERVIVHDERDAKYHELRDPVTQLRDWLSDGAYADALRALGETPLIDL
ncbi:MAG: hypothetical protein H0T20_01270 [Actinobacteria bacterium]|nr:hypothetical protein [Actinomycetota bacterium]